MKKKLFFIWRGIIAISRDMFTGFIMGLCSALIMLKINPAVSQAVGLLIPAGTIAGVFKGTAKFIFLSLSGVLPTIGYSHSYLKYKILVLWLIVLGATLTGVYGGNFGQWVSGPIGLLEDNVVLGSVGRQIWEIIIIFILAIGLFSYFYEPRVPGIADSESDSNNE